MGRLVCDDCGTDLETGTVAETLKGGGTVRRERTYCPCCRPAGAD